MKTNEDFHEVPMSQNWWVFTVTTASNVHHLRGRLKSFDAPDPKG